MKFGILLVRRGPVDVTADVVLAHLGRKLIPLHYNPPEFKYLCLGSNKYKDRKNRMGQDEGHCNPYKLCYVQDTTLDDVLSHCSTSPCLLFLHRHVAWTSVVRCPRVSALVYMADG
jgi:hypothetical protein